jgi:Exonuclease VII, large subunit
MPEKLPDKLIFSLAEVARSIQKTIADRYRSVYWIKAEMNKLNHYSHSGHCYPDLVEKKNGKVVAEMRAVLWNGDYQRINQRFLQVTKEPLKNGITILFQATISYDPLYGLSLRILDIDPAFSLGELEREKLECIERLKREDLFYANKRLTLPVVPKRLAIISVETSKGYSDFLKILKDNPWGYRFEYKLFPALLQGDKSITSIIGQLATIAEGMDKYDIAAIIRGGGGEVGLSSYNNYLLAAAVSTFPIPVLTGIGHSTNETVVEMVAYHNAITPTELADFLIQRFHDFAAPLEQTRQTLVRTARQSLGASQERLDHCVRYFRLSSIHLLSQQRKTLSHQELSLRAVAATFLKSERQVLESPHQALRSTTVNFLRNCRSEVQSTEKSIHLLDPQQVLNRGYSITRINGSALKSNEKIRRGDEVETILAHGSMISIVSELKPKENE